MFVHLHATTKYIPKNDHYAPHKTANNKQYLQDNKGGGIEILLPEFPQSKMVHIKPDIIKLPVELGLHIYDFFIWVKTMPKRGIK